MGRHLLGGLCYPFRFAFPPNCVIVFGILVHDNFLFLSPFLSFLFSRIIFPTLCIGDDGGWTGRVHFSLCWFTSRADLFWLYLFVDVFPQSPAVRVPSDPRHGNGQHALNVIVSTCLFDMARSAVPQQQRSRSGWALFLNIWNIHIPFENKHVAVL